MLCWNIYKWMSKCYPHFTDTESEAQRDTAHTANLRPFIFTPHFSPICGIWEATCFWLIGFYDSNILWCVREDAKFRETRRLQGSLSPILSLGVPVNWVPELC